MHRVENRTKTIPQTGCNETSLYDAMTMPPFMKQSTNNRAFNFYYFVSFEARTIDIMMAVDNPK